MTFGEKLKKARKEAGLSQEQLAEKLIVSRSAIAKWESDKGLPDIHNLKAIAQLLNISVDELLDENETLTFRELKEPISLGDYEMTGKCRNQKDAAVLTKFPGASAVTVLLREKKLSPLEHILEWTIMPAFGLFQAVDQYNDKNEWYLVECGGKQYLAAVSEEFIISQEMAKQITEKKFTIGEYTFKRFRSLL